MAKSSTVIIALKFSKGVIIAADSQATDQIGGVRWPVEKLSRINNLPIVVGFSGNTGISGRAREALQSSLRHRTQTDKLSRIRNNISKCLDPYYDEIKGKNSKVPPDSFLEIGLWGLVACWSEQSPHIIEYELDGDHDVHQWFHAIGSGTSTAWRTLGERNLVKLDERKALWVALRILRTCIGVEMYGVSEPLHAWVVTEKGTRRVSEDERNAHFQAISEWEQRELSSLLNS